MKNVLFLLIGGIILLHTVISHRHVHYRNDACELHVPQTDITLFDGIKFTFSIDHGEGHLEHFIDSSVPLVCLPSTEIQPQKFVIGLNDWGSVYSAVLLPALCLPPDPLRGPPSLS